MSYSDRVLEGNTLNPLKTYSTMLVKKNDVKKDKKSKETYELIKYNMYLPSQKHNIFRRTDR